MSEICLFGTNPELLPKIAPDMSDPPVPRPLAGSPVGRRAQKHRFWGERTAATTPHRLVLEIRYKLYCIYHGFSWEYFWGCHSWGYNSCGYNILIWELDLGCVYIYIINTMINDLGIFGACLEMGYVSPNSHFNIVKVMISKPWCLAARGPSRLIRSCGRCIYTLRRFSSNKHKWGAFLY